MHAPLVISTAELEVRDRALPLLGGRTTGCAGDLFAEAFVSERTGPDCEKGPKKEPIFKPFSAPRSSQLKLTLQACSTRGESAG